MSILDRRRRLNPNYQPSVSRREDMRYGHMPDGAHPDGGVIRGGIRYGSQLADDLRAAMRGQPVNSATVNRGLSAGGSPVRPAGMGGNGAPQGMQNDGRQLVAGYDSSTMPGAQPMQSGQTMQPGVQPGQDTFGKPGANQGFQPVTAQKTSSLQQPAGLATGQPQNTQPGFADPSSLINASLASGNLGGGTPSGGGMAGNMPGGGINFGQTSSGVAGAEQAMQGGLRGGLGLLMQGTEQARGDLMQAGQGANNTLNPFYAPGQQSNQYQAALSGALGNQAQQQAMDNFMGSPGQQYLLNESERAIRRNAAATGGLGGGNVQRALQENAIGLAAQDFGNAFNRLGTVSDRGLAAGGQISGNAMTTGAGLANFTNQNANTGANMIFGTGNQIGAGRNRAGEMIAGNIQGTSGNLANLMYGTGQDISNTIGSGASELIRALQMGGASDAEVLMAYANALAGNTQTGASTFVGQQGLGSTQNIEARGTVGDVGSAIGGIAGAAKSIGALFSDRRLKQDIKRIGTVRGHNLYQWNWTDEARRFVGGQPSVGVMADEVPPEFVVRGDDGYMRVDYGRLLHA